MVAAAATAANRAETKTETRIMACDGVLGKTGRVSLFEEIEVEGLCGRSLAYRIS
jgi:hypothetical protein